MNDKSGMVPKQRIMERKEDVAVNLWIFDTKGLMLIIYSANKPANIPAAEEKWVLSPQVYIVVGAWGQTAVDLNGSTADAD